MEDRQKKLDEKRKRKKEVECKRSVFINLVGTLRSGIKEIEGKRSYCKRETLKDSLSDIARYTVLFNALMCKGGTLFKEKKGRRRLPRNFVNLQDNEHSVNTFN